MLKKISNIFTRANGNLMNHLKNTRYLHRECDDDPGPRCDKRIDPPKKEEDDCTKRQRMSELRRPVLSYVSMWEDPECCRKYTCPNHQVRFDDLYWKPTDKYKRKYMRTWVECPEYKIVPVECERPDEDVCPPEYRPRKKPRPQCNARDIGLMRCTQGQRKGCHKIRWPNCRPVAKNKNKCKKYRSLSDCKKFCTKYPSFSECKHDHKVPPYLGECRCLALPMQCEIYAEKLRLEKMDAYFANKRFS